MLWAMSPPKFIEGNPSEVTNVKSVYQIITNKVIELLSKGAVPWQKPWNQAESVFPAFIRSRSPVR